MTRRLTLLSIVVPCFNEEAVLAQTHERLIRLGADRPIEVIYVDDGSSDRTRETIRALSAADPRVSGVVLARNFGHQVAVSAGLERARGDVVVVIDADLQDPPEVIPEMIRAWSDGSDVVHARRTEREGETAFKLWTASIYYRVISRLADTPIHVDSGDFKLMDRKVVNALLTMPERDRFLRGMVSWVGFRQTDVPYKRAARAAGVTKYPLSRMLRFAADGVFSFSLVPLRLATAMGFAASLLSALGIIYALVLRLFTSIWVSGWTLLFIAVLFMAGVQLISLGILGEYIGRMYREIKGRPLFIVAEEIGRRDDAAPAAGIHS